MDVWGLCLGCGRWFYCEKQAVRENRPRCPQCDAAPVRTVDREAERRAGHGRAGHGRDGHGRDGRAAVASMRTRRAARVVPLRADRA